MQYDTKHHNHSLAGWLTDKQTNNRALWPWDIIDYKLWRYSTFYELRAMLCIYLHFCLQHSNGTQCNQQPTTTKEKRRKCKKGKNTKGFPWQNLENLQNLWPNYLSVALFWHNSWLERFYYYALHLPTTHAQIFQWNSSFVVVILFLFYFTSQKT